MLRFATSRTSQELELSALPPAPRGRWKVLLRGAVWPAGAAARRARAVRDRTGGAARTDALAGVAIAIAIAWAIAARIAARRFQTALAAPLGIRKHARDDPRRIDLDDARALDARRRRRRSEQAALARAALARARVDATDLADHLRHDEPAVRAALFDQLARVPTPALRGELRAAIGIEDDDRALVLGIKALAIAGDDAGITPRQSARRPVARRRRRGPQTARARCCSGDDAACDYRRRARAILLARDPAWAVAFARARRGDLPDDVLAAQLRDALATRRRAPARSP